MIWENHFQNHNDRVRAVSERASDSLGIGQRILTKRRDASQRNCSVASRSFIDILSIAACDMATIRRAGRGKWRKFRRRKWRPCLLADVLRSYGLCYSNTFLSTFDGSLIRPSSSRVTFANDPGWQRTARPSELWTTITTGSRMPPRTRFVSANRGCGVGLSWTASGGYMGWLI